MREQHELVEKCKCYREISSRCGGDGEARMSFPEFPTDLLWSKFNKAFITEL